MYLCFAVVLGRFTFKVNREVCLLVIRKVAGLVSFHEMNV